MPVIRELTSLVLSGIKLEETEIKIISTTSAADSPYGHKAQQYLPFPIHKLAYIHRLWPFSYLA